MSNETGILYVVATPIGNLEDLSKRAGRILASVETIYAEDTRHSSRLLKQLGITTNLKSLHDHNERDLTPKIMQQLLEGQDLALISDAGTPLISDPGYFLVQQIQQANIPVSPIPGPSAVISALSVAGIPSDHFRFEGFIPAKSLARKECFQSLCRVSQTLIFYETPHRILNSLKDAIEIFGPDRMAAIARELTKMHEDIKRDTLQALFDWLLANEEKQRGEFVLLISGIKEKKSASEIESQRILAILLKELSTKKAAEVAAGITGMKKNQLYQMALEIQS